MLTICIIFMVSLVCAEKMWYFSVDLRRRHCRRTAEVVTMILGCIILGVGEIAVVNDFLVYAEQQVGVEEKMIAYAMMIYLAVVQLMATFEAMKKYRRIDDKLVILGISLFCLLIGGVSALI